MAVEAAAAVSPAEMIQALIQRVSNQETAAHRKTVVKQFTTFLAGRAPSGELANEFLIANAASGKYKPNTMWSRRSHLIFYMRNELTPSIELERFLGQLDTALSAMSKQHVTNRAAAFTHQNLFDFWANAPNEGELFRAKAVSLVGFFGCARTAELVPLVWSDIREAPDGVWVKLYRKKCAADTSRQEILIPKLTGHRVVPSELFLAYKNSILSATIKRGALCQRVFRGWRDKTTGGSWVNQPAGVETLKKAPKLVATFLGLNPDQYRGHSWRPSGASALATNGGTAAQLQTAGNWQHLESAQQYIRDGPEQRRHIAEVLAGPDSQPEDEPKDPPPVHQTTAPQLLPLGPPPTKVPRIIFQAPLTNCTITINFAQQ